MYTDNDDDDNNSIQQQTNPSYHMQPASPHMQKTQALRTVLDVLCKGRCHQLNRATVAGKLMNGQVGLIGKVCSSLFFNFYGIVAILLPGTLGTRLWVNVVFLDVKIQVWMVWCKSKCKQADLSWVTCKGGVSLHFQI